ncbi:hypothetical protein ACJ73_01350 [Blastomyces percursus]|uniref:Uncharacterized protein n=1 Tax=Blastomyces percursus TaxID=1658174 RepID=A0A1J9QGM3_9EURO|nr:hypothetical protein ACJ73_01350 [Blastomyces percursus]
MSLCDEVWEGLYALYSNSQTCQNYIVMEHVADETLAKLWASVCAEKDSIVVKLCGYYEELRQLPSPGYYGSIDK